MSDGLAVVSSLKAPSYRDGLLRILGDSNALNKIKCQIKIKIYLKNKLWLCNYNSIIGRGRLRSIAVTMFNEREGKLNRKERDSLKVDLMKWSKQCN